MAQSLATAVQSAETTPPPLPATLEMVSPLLSSDDGDHKARPSENVHNPWLAAAGVRGCTRVHTLRAAKADSGLTA